MMLALKDFEGAPCRDQKIQNALKMACRGETISRVEKKARGIVAHFRRSDKVRNPRLLMHSFYYCT